MNRLSALFTIVVLGLSGCHEPEPTPAARFEYANFEVLERNSHNKITSIIFRSSPGISQGYVDSLGEVYQVIFENVDSIPGILGSLPKLGWVSINNSPNLKKLPPSFADLPSLKFMNINGTSVEELPETFRNAKELKTIYMVNNPGRLVESLAILPNLEKLSLSTTESSPKKFPSMPALVDLRISGSMLPQLGAIPNLGTLEISGSSASTLPDDIGTLTKLKTIRINGHQTLLTIGNSVTSCVALENLYLSGNPGGIILPSRLGDLKALKVLYMKENGIETIPESIGGLRSLEEWTISMEKVKELPHSIGQLSRLNMFAVVQSSLENIPDEVGQLANLEFLALTNNLLTTLPSTVGNLKKLWNFDVGNNKITDVPETIGDLPLLRTLGLDHNQLTTLPIEAIKRLPRLKYLSVGNNQIPKPQIDELKGALPSLQIWE